MESEEECVGDDLCHHVCTHGRLHVYEPACVLTCTHTYTHSLFVCQSLKYVGIVGIPGKAAWRSAPVCNSFMGLSPHPMCECVSVCGMFF